MADPQTIAARTAGRAGAGAAELTPAAARLTVLAACLGWLFSAVDIVLLMLFQRPVAEALGSEPQAIRIAIGVGLLGSAVGGIAFAQLGDRYGRVRALGWCVLLYSLATAGMGLARNVHELMAWRFAAGIGTGAEWSIGFALITEVQRKAGRGRVGGLVAGMFNLGTFVAIALFQSPLGWRWSFGAMALPALLVLWLRLRVPESPLWLAWQQARARGELDARLQAQSRLAPLALLLRGRLRALTLKATLLFVLMNFAFYAFSTVFINYLQDDSARGGLGLDAQAQFPFQLALNLGALASVVAAGALSDRIGRHAAFALFCGIGGAGSAWLYVVTQGGAGSTAQLLAAFTIVVVGYGVNGVVGTLLAELFPTHVRAAGAGLAQNLGKGIGGMAGPPLVGALAASAGYPLALALPGAVVLALAALIWLLPRVGGRELRAVEDERYLDAQRGRRGGALSSRKARVRAPRRARGIRPS
ncbi:MAG: MFS transporter [Rubrivivax sp.]